MFLRGLIPNTLCTLNESEVSPNDRRRVAEGYDFVQGAAIVVDLPVCGIVLSEGCAG
jgi:hypothetical protein